MITVVTSLPPTPPQRVIDNNLLRDSYRLACFNSWNQLGDRVASVNSYKESEYLMESFPGVEVLTVSSDGSEKSGKPLVLLDDLIREAKEMDSEIIAFTNADIFLARVKQIKGLLAEVTSGHAIIANRTDIESLDKVQGSTYRGGYDLFIVHRDDLSKISTKNDLYFGDPWWDYHALCNLILSGVSVTALDSSHVLHLSHDFAFTWDRWVDIGIETLEELYATVKDRKFDKKNIYSKELADLIKKFLINVHRCGKPAYIHYARMMFGKKACKLDRNLLLKYAKALDLFAEHSIGFQSAEQEQIALGCAELKAALSQT